MPSLTELAGRARPESFGLPTCVALVLWLVAATPLACRGPGLDSPDLDESDTPDVAVGDGPTDPLEDSIEDGDHGAGDADAADGQATDGATDRALDWPEPPDDAGRDDRAPDSPPTDLDARLDGLGDLATETTDITPDADTAQDFTQDSAPDPRTCDEIIASLEARTATARLCQRSSQCAVRDNPLCPVGGCFTVFTTGYDVTDLDADEAAFVGGSCGSPTCACPPEAPSVLSCNEGECDTCPSGCPYACDLDCPCWVDGCGCDQPVCVEATDESCNQLVELAVEATSDLAGCTYDDDCQVYAPGLCPHLPCYIGVNRHAPTAHLATLVAAIGDAECDLVDCSCEDPPGVACVEGNCQLSE